MKQPINPQMSCPYVWYDHDAAMTIRGYASNAAIDVMTERRRQIVEEGMRPEDDDKLVDRSLAKVAACYVVHASKSPQTRAKLYMSRMIPKRWPDSWAKKWWKPKNRRRDLVRAAALIIAEIERIDRAKEDEQ